MNDSGLRAWFLARWKYILCVLAVSNGSGGRIVLLERAK
jgi:hypothetical protein